MLQPWRRRGQALRQRRGHAMWRRRVPYGGGVQAMRRRVRVLEVAREDWPASCGGDECRIWAQQASICAMFIGRISCLPLCYSIVTLFPIAGSRLAAWGVLAWRCIMVAVLGVLPREDEDLLLVCPR